MPKIITVTMKKENSSFFKKLTTSILNEFSSFFTFSS